jgi:biopolymer transport protein ExbD
MRRKDPTEPLPQINLVPMLDVMMAVLTFFILITISLSLEKSVAFRLPADRYPEATEPLPLMLEIREDGIRLEGKPLSLEESLAQTQDYLTSHTQGFILLRPAPTLTYQQMMDVLVPIQAIGGDRVSLVLPQEPENAP